MANTATLDDLVLDINVTLDAAAVDAASFDTILIGGPNKTASGAETFTSLTAVTDGTGITSSHPEYRAARDAFANGASRVAIGKVRARQAQVTTIEITTAADGVWTVTIGEDDYTFTASGSATATAIATGLQAALAAASSTATVSRSSATLTLTAATAGRGFTVDVAEAAGGASTTTEVTANRTIGDEIDSILSSFPDWYVYVHASTDEEDIYQAAQWIEANGRRVQIAQSADADIIDAGDSDDVASILDAASYTRTSVWYHGSASTENLAAAIAASALQADPDTQSTTWAHRTLSGITVGAISTTQRDAALAKGANVYLRLKGVGKTWPGIVSSGKFIDEIFVADWFRARIEEDCAQAFSDASARNSKIPFTDEGFTVFETIVRKRYQQGVNAGHFEADTLELTIPKRADVSSQDVAARHFSFSGSVGLAGAAHSVAFDVNLTYAR